MKSINNAVTILIILLGFCYISVAVAHEAAGTLGRKTKKAGGTDISVVSCYDDGNGAPDHLYMNVIDTRQPRNPAIISAQVVVPSTGAASGVVIDPVDGDAFPSAGITLAGGIGPYHIHITKTRSRKMGIEIYGLNFHCETATGVHTGTEAPEVIQNQ